MGFKEVDEHAFLWASANRLAYQVARLVLRDRISSRSGASDALLDYLNVGGIDGPKDVCEWVRAYEDEHNVPLPERLS